MKDGTIPALKSVVEYISNCVQENTYDTDADYRYGLGYADGLSDALEIVTRIENGESIAKVIKEVVEKEDK